MVPSLWSHFIIIASDSPKRSHSWDLHTLLFLPATFPFLLVYISPPWLLRCLCLTPSFSLTLAIQTCPSLSFPDSPSISKSRGHQGLSSEAWACRAVARSTLPGFGAINVSLCPSLRTWVFRSIRDISAKILQFAPNQSWSSLETWEQRLSGGSRRGTRSCDQSFVSDEKG